jgi:hypothetical protein
MDNSSVKFENHIFSPGIFIVIPLEAIKNVKMYFYLTYLIAKQSLTDSNKIYTQAI